MVQTRRKKKPLPVTVADPDAVLSLREAAKMAQVSTATIRDRRPLLIEAGAVQVNPTRWNVTPRHLDAAGLIRIRTPKPEADPLEAAQAAREKARREQTADPYAARVAQDAEHAQTAAENPGNPGITAAGLDARDSVDARVRRIAEPSRVAALELELAEARHALELAEHARKLAEAQAAARAWEDRAKTFELLAAERAQMIAVLQAMLGGAAPVTRALDA